jgi:hypothetical protein
MTVAENWKEVLLEAARQNYAASRQGIILSRIPSILRQSGIEKQDILQGGRKLRELIENEARGVLRLIQNEDSKLDWSIIPYDIEISTPHSKYFPKPRQSSESHAPQRFVSIFWHAFTKHIPPGHRRWLLRGPNISTEDRVGAEAPDGAIEIERIYTAKPDELVIANALVIERIEQWANVHGVQSREFLMSQVSRPQHIMNRIEERSLANMMKFMSMDDLSRISVPLDILSRYLDSNRER